MALRLRGDFTGAVAVTLSRHLGGDEIARVTGEVSGGRQGEIIFADPAAAIRELPATEVEIRLTARDGAGEREIGRYTLVHGGALHR